MSYVTEISNALAGTLKKLTVLNRHQLAGHVANFGFWTGEVQHCLGVIDTYRGRFEAMKAAQMKHAVDHSTAEFAIDDRYDLGQSVPPPKPVPDSQLKDARRTLCEAYYRFALRCHNATLLDKAVVQQALGSLGISIDSKDLNR
ncbi:MAG: hypothetical protein JSS02_33700 [Planctomycetes bacterium]|nr:hypothetical protein [Planctomycetota bacterium]